MIFLIFKGQYKDQQLIFEIETIVKSYHKLQELLVFIKILKLQLLHLILVRNIEQFWQKIELCPTKTVFEMYLSKKILYHYFAVFCSAWDSVLSENILFVIPFP